MKDIHLPNTTTSKPTILLFTAAEGHYSLAVALKQELQEKHTVVEIIEPIVLSQSYLFFYRWFPALFKIPYLLSQKAFLTNFGTFLYGQKKVRKYEALIIEHKPVACVSTYFMCSVVLSNLQPKYGYELINIVANPWTVHPVEIITHGINCVFDEITHQATLKLDATATIFTSGWLVRPEFEEVYELKKVRGELNLNPDLLTLTLVAGSEGSQKALSILPQLIQLNTPLQIIVACGNSEYFFKKISELAEKARREKSPVKIIPLTFIQRMAPYLQAADLVIGKAGPNTLFEAVACNKPFFALSHISGQEDGNIEIIKYYKIGYVEENIPAAAVLLKTIIQHPEQLKEFQPALRKLSDFNKDASKRIVALLRK